MSFQRATESRVEQRRSLSCRTTSDVCHQQYLVGYLALDDSAWYSLCRQRHDHSLLGKNMVLVRSGTLARLARTRALIDSHCPARCPTTFVDVTSHCCALLLARLAWMRPLIDSHCRAHCQSTLVDVTSHCCAVLRSHARQCYDHSQTLYKYQHDRVSTTSPQKHAATQHNHHISARCLPQDRPRSHGTR